MKKPDSQKQEVKPSNTKVQTPQLKDVKNNQIKPGQKGKNLKEPEIEEKQVVIESKNICIK